MSITLLRIASLAALAAAGLWQGQAPAGPPTPRDRERYRAGLTATVMEAGASDTARTGCRLVSLEWRPLAGAARYDVEVRLGARGAWMAARSDPRCPTGGAGAAGATAFRDRVMRPAPERDYRVVAVAADGRLLDVTAAVPVKVR